MPINVFRIILDMLTESYVLALFVFFIGKILSNTSESRNTAFLNFLNILGLSLAVLLVVDEVITFMEKPTNNYVAKWQSAPYWKACRIASIIALSTSALIFSSKSRRTTPIWIYLGVLLLLSLKLAVPLVQYMGHKYYHPSESYISYPWFWVFYKETWWTIMLCAAIILVIGYLFIRKTK